MVPMKNLRYTDSQIIVVLKHAGADARAPELCREFGIAA